MTGQLNMFDLFNSVDAMEPGEVEMVSLVPNFEEDPHPVVVEEAPVMEEKTAVVEEEQEVEEEPAVEEEAVVVKPRENQDDVAMSRSYKINGEKIEIAYINYNKVRITRGKKAPEIKEFASTKEAVDYYVEQMQELEIDE